MYSRRKWRDIVRHLFYLRLILTKFGFYAQIKVISLVSYFTKICPAGAELSNANRRT